MPKIIGKSLAEHRERTRTALFDALATLMRKRGFDAISLADIAAGAGIGRTAIYNHFPDKESLLLAYIENQTSEYVRRLEAAIAEVDAPVEQLRVYVREQIGLGPAYHVAPGPDLRAVVSREALAGLREHVGQVEQVLRTILADAIEAGDIPEQNVDAVVHLVHACLSGRSVPRGAPEREEFVASTELFVLRAVGVPDAAPVRAVEVA
ncbi:MAG: TetR/AcrR family transcriptional regulator [Georgenia sp.]